MTILFIMEEDFDHEKSVVTDFNGIDLFGIGIFQRYPCKRREIDKKR